MTQTTASTRPQAGSGPKPTLVTIPGARNRSPWQNLIQTVMGPHFHCERYHYTDYSGFGGLLAVLIDVRWLIGAVVLLVLGLLFPWPAELYPWPRYLLPAGSLICAAFAIHRARQDRALCAERFNRWMNDLGLRSPHVIADSFGAYLVGSALRNHADARIQNLVLAAAPLPRQYPWVPSVNGKVAKVRSEIASPDLRTRLLFFVGWFAEDLGDAARSGFIANRTVHTAFADGLCADCEVQTHPAPVHNVMLQHRRGHQMLNRSYLQEYWLPFLWNIAIIDFSRLLQSARQAVEYERGSYFDLENELLEEMLASTFSWTGRLTLEGWMRASVTEFLDRDPTGQDPEEVFKFVKFAFLHAVDKANAESAQLGSRDEDLIRCLHPRTALMKLMLASRNAL